MNAKTATHTPGELADFVAEVLASLVRKDQRATSSFYLQELMLEGRRKSMQHMAERLGIDHQRLQQFVSTSPWPVEPVRKALATKAIDLIEPDAWVIDDTGFIKDGSASPGVARQYLRHPGQGRQCSDRGQRPRRHRYRVVSVELAVVSPRQLG